MSFGPNHKAPRSSKPCDDGACRKHPVAPSIRRYRQWPVMDRKLNRATLEMDIGLGKGILLLVVILESSLRMHVV